MENTDPQEVFKSGNQQLANKLKDLVHKAVDKSHDMLEHSENQYELLTAIKIAETAGKITGIVQEKQQINMQINNIAGFTFIEIDKPNVEQTLDLKQEDNLLINN